MVLPPAVGDGTTTTDYFRARTSVLSSVLADGSAAYTPGGSAWYTLHCDNSNSWTSKLIRTGFENSFNRAMEKRGKKGLHDPWVPGYGNDPWGRLW